MALLNRQSGWQAYLEWKAAFLESSRPILGTEQRGVAPAAPIAACSLRFHHALVGKSENGVALKR